MVVLIRRLFLIVLSFLLLAGIAHAVLPGELKDKIGTVEGRIMVDSKPLSYAIVSFFSANNGPVPSTARVQRVPDMVSRTDDKGYFSARLLGGRYYIGALVRKRGGEPVLRGRRNPDILP